MSALRRARYRWLLSVMCGSLDNDAGTRARAETGVSESESVSGKAGAAAAVPCGKGTVTSARAWPAPAWFSLHLNTVCGMRQPQARCFSFFKLVKTV
jgi:hypothetical protein